MTPRRLLLVFAAVGACAATLVAGLFVGRAVGADDTAGQVTAEPMVVDVGAARALLVDEGAETDGENGAIDGLLDDRLLDDAFLDDAFLDDADGVTGEGETVAAPGAGGGGVDRDDVLAAAEWMEPSPWRSAGTDVSVPDPDELRERVGPDEVPPYVPDGPILLGDLDLDDPDPEVLEAAGLDPSDLDDGDGPPADEPGDDPWVLGGLDLGDFAGVDAPWFVDLCVVLDEEEGAGEVPEEAICPEGHGGTILLAIDDEPGSEVVVATWATTRNEEDRERPGACEPSEALAGDEVMVQIGLSRPADLVVEWYPLLRGFSLTHEARTLEIDADDDLRPRYEERRTAGVLEAGKPWNTWTCVVLDAPRAGYWLVDVHAVADDGGIGRSSTPMTSTGWHPDPDERSAQRRARGRAAYRNPITAPLVELSPIGDHAAALFLLDAWGRPGGTGHVAALPRDGWNATDMTCREWEAVHTSGDRSWDDRDQIIDRRRRGGSVQEVTDGTAGPLRGPPIGNRYALLEPRHGVTYELCVRRLAGLDRAEDRGLFDPTVEQVWDRGSLTFTAPRIARPRIEIVGTEQVDAPIDSVSVTATNWSRPGTAFVEDVPAGRAAGAALTPRGEEWQRTAVPSQGRVPEVTHLVVRNGATGATVEMALRTPSRACGSLELLCSNVSPTRFVLVPIPGERSATGVCSEAFGDDCEPPGSDDRAGLMMLQVTMEDHQSSSLHSENWALDSMRSVSGPTPPEPGPEPEVVQIRWRLADRNARFNQTPGGEPVNATWTFDRPVLGATFESRDSSVDFPEECHRDGAVLHETPRERIVLELESICPGWTTVVFPVTVIDADGEVLEVSPEEQFRTTAFLSAPHQEAVTQASVRVLQPGGGPVEVTIPRLSVGNREYLGYGDGALPGADGCHDRIGWRSGSRSGRSLHGVPSRDAAVFSMRHVVLPERCGEERDLADYLEGENFRLVGAVDGPPPPRQSDAVVSTFELPVGAGDDAGRAEIELSHTFWLMGSPTLDQWRDRNVGGGPHQYEPLDPLDCGPSWDPRPCRIRSDD